MLLDTKVFKARAVLATEVKVVIISPSMLELSIKVAKIELCSRPRPPKLELCSSSSSTTRPRAHLSVLSDQTLCLFPFPSVASAYVFTCSLSVGI